MKKSKKSIKSKIAYKPKLKSKIRIKKQRIGVKDIARKIRPLSEKELLRLDKTLRKIEKNTLYDKGLNRVPEGFAKATMTDSDKEVIDVTLVYGVKSGVLSDVNLKKIQIDRKTMDVIEDANKMEQGGYAAGGKYQTNIHGEKPTDYKIICKIIRQNGKDVQVCYYETSDKKVKGVELYSGKDYIVGSSDVKYSKKYDELSDVPIKYKAVVDELIKVHHKTFECGGEMSKGGELREKVLLEIGTVINILEFGKDRNVEMTLKEIEPLSKKDIKEGLGRRSYHFVGSKGRSQWYPEATLQERLNENSIQIDYIKTNRNLKKEEGGSMAKGSRISESSLDKLRHLLDDIAIDMEGEDEEALASLRHDLDEANTDSEAEKLISDFEKGMLNQIFDTKAKKRIKKAIADYRSNVNNMEKGGKMVYNVSYMDKEGEVVDSTQVDEKDEELAWDLFREFGHTKKPGMYLEWEKVKEMARGGEVNQVKYHINRPLTDYEIAYLQTHGVETDESYLDDADEENNILTLIPTTKKVEASVQEIFEDALGNKKEYRNTVVKKMDCGGEMKAGGKLKYKAVWGDWDNHAMNSYKPKSTIENIDFFSPDNGYEESDILAIRNLKEGETYNVTYGNHTVTAIKEMSKGGKLSDIEQKAVDFLKNNIEKDSDDKFFEGFEKEFKGSVIADTGGGIAVGLIPVDKKTIIGVGPETGNVVKYTVKESGGIYDIFYDEDAKQEMLYEAYSKGGTMANKKVGKVMHEFKHGKLKSHGRTVTDRDQAIAIGMSESGQSRRKEKGGQAGSILTQLKDIELKLNSKGVFLKDIDEHGIGANSTFEGHDIEEYNYTDDKGGYRKLSKDIQRLIDEYNMLSDDYYTELNKK